MRMKSAKKWDAVTTVKFVNLYKEHECLWNPLSEFYKFRRARAHAVNEMINKMNIDGLDPREVTQKIRSLRSTYTQEIRKLEKTPHIDNHSKLPWFDVMDEIMTKIQNREPASESAKSHFESFMDHSDNEDAEAEEFETETLDTDLFSDSNSYNNSKEITYNEVYKQRDFTPVQDSPEESNEPPKRRKRVKSRNRSRSVDQEDNEFDIFGQSVAAQLKKLSVIQALIAQHQIQSILSRCRITDIKSLQSNLSETKRNNKRKRKRRVESIDIEDPLPICESKESARQQISLLYDNERNPIEDDE